MDSLSFIDFLSSSFYIPFLGFPVCDKRETLLAALPFLLDPQPEPEPLIAGAVSSVSRSVFFVFPLIHSSYPSSTFSVLVLSFSFLCFFPEPDHHKQPGICESKAQEDPDSSIHRLQNYTAETYHSLPQRPWPLLLLLLLPPQPYRKEGGDSRSFVLRWCPDISYTIRPPYELCPCISSRKVGSFLLHMITGLMGLIPTPPLFSWIYGWNSIWVFFSFIRF